MSKQEKAIGSRVVRLSELRKKLVIDAGLFKLNGEDSQ